MGNRPIQASPMPASESDSPTHGSLSRRGFLQAGAASAIALGLSPMNGTALTPASHTEASSMMGVAFEAKEPRLGIIGVGGRGTSLLEDLLAANAKVRAICDVVREKAKHAQQLIENRASMRLNSIPRRSCIRALVARDDLDLVIIATPWRWHVPMAVAAMRHGKHVAVEVPAATTIEDCWQLVNTSEADPPPLHHARELLLRQTTRRLILRMVHAGLLGDLLYGEGAYLHDLREELFQTRVKACGGGLSTPELDGNLYPTHGLGPVANYMGINRGDRFDYLVSMSTPQRGLDDYRKAHLTGRPTLAGAVHHRRHEYIADQDREWADDHPEARRLQPAAIRSIEYYRRNEGSLH